MSKITYRENPGVEIVVYLDGKRVGKIKNYGMIGYVYVPKGQKTGGTPHRSLDALKREIEG